MHHLGANSFINSMKKILVLIILSFFSLNNFSYSIEKDPLTERIFLGNLAKILGGYASPILNPPEYLNCTNISNNDVKGTFYISSLNRSFFKLFLPSIKNLPNGVQLYNFDHTSDNKKYISKALALVFNDESINALWWAEGGINSKKKYYYVINELSKDYSKLQKIRITFDKNFLKQNKDIKKSIIKLSEIRSNSLNFAEQQPGKNLYKEADLYVKNIIDISVEAKNIVEKNISSFETQEISFYEYNCKLKP